jgi:hypothetical protein
MHPDVANTTLRQFLAFSSVCVFSGNSGSFVKKLCDWARKAHEI